MTIQIASFFPFINTKEINNKDELCLWCFTFYRTQGDLTSLCSGANHYRERRATTADCEKTFPCTAEETTDINIMLNIVVSS